MKNILIINGHPNPKSYCNALTDAYEQGASTQDANITRINLYNLKFDLNLEFGYQKRKDLEPDLQNSIDLILAADHIVWIFPMWWYSTPALLKGFIDRTFLPGITYGKTEGNGFPPKLLKGKSSRIIITADTPRWYDYLFMKSPAINQFKKGTLQFCGINPVKVTYIAPIKNSKEEFRNKWILKVKKLGTALQ